MPFTLPDDAAETQALALNAQTAWGPRNKRMWDDQRAWELRPLTLDNGELSYRLNICTAQVNKATEMMSAAEMRLRVAPHTDQDRSRAQRIEDLLRWARDEFEYRYATGLQNGLQYDLCHYLNLRGWTALRLVLNPDEPQFPWQIDLLDPMDVYPYPWDGPPDAYFHIYGATVPTLRARWGKEIDDILSPDNTATRPGAANQSFQVIACYTATEMAILLQGQWVKRPTAHHYGFCPLFVQTATGQPYRVPNNLGSDASTSSTNGAGQRFPSEDWSAYVGTSLLHPIRSTVDDMQQMVLTARTMAEKSADPPTIAYVANPGADNLNEVPTDAGTTATYERGDSYNQYPPPPAALQHATALISLAQDQINRAALSPAVYGDQGQSGFQDWQAAGAATDVLKPRMQALRLLWRRVFRALLRLYARYGNGEDPVQFTAMNRDTGMITAANRITPLEVAGSDIGVDVQFGELGMSDKVAMGNLAGALMERGVVDYEYALGELLKVDNPQQVRRRAIRDQADKIPQLVQIRALYEKAQDVTDPLGAQFAAMMMHAAMERFTQSLQPPAPPSAPGAQTPGAQGPPPGMAQTGPPPSGTQLPSAALPDEMGGHAGAGPNGTVPGMQSPVGP